MSAVLPTDSKARKDVPLARGVLDYFPAALAYVARISKAGNDKHNPGEELHHARGKSTDHADCIVRHLVDRGTIDPEDGLRHSGKVAWRALALLQEELEAAGEAPLARGARLPEAANDAPKLNLGDDWIDWLGSPGVAIKGLAQGDTVDLLFRSGHKSLRVDPSFWHCYRWNHEGNGGDIVAYRKSK